MNDYEKSMFSFHAKCNGSDWGRGDGLIGATLEFTNTSCGTGGRGEPDIPAGECEEKRCSPTGASLLLKLSV